MLSFDVFCNVIDNFGDLGVCLRLSMDLSSLGHKVSLYCDSLETYEKIKPKNLLKDNNKLNILKWDKHLQYKASDIVILAFSCHVSDNLLDEIKAKKSTVINLEYLSAEDFVESCHLRPSFINNLNAYFFFPGVTDKTGSVVIEKAFKEKIKSYYDNKYNLNLDVLDKDKYERKVSVFSYENDRIEHLVHAFSKSKKRTLMQVFEGKSLDNLNNKLHLNLKVNETHNIDNLTIKAVAMTDIISYDDVLLNSDINLVRGEDSIVRAMLCGKPFLWQIYMQDEDTHIIKLNAMLSRIKDVVKDKANIDNFIKLLNSYNGNGDYLLNVDIDEEEKNMQIIAKLWSLHLQNLGSQTNKLIEFCKDVSK